MLSAQTRAEMRRLTALAWPVMLTSLQWIVLNFMDTAMVGHAGTQELAYMNAGRALTWTAMNIGAFGLLSGVIVFAARADGAGDKRRCGDVLRQGILYAAVIALVMLLLLELASPLMMRWLDIPDDQRAGGVSFTRLMGIAMAVRTCSLPGTYFLEGISKPRPAMVLAMMTLPINLLLNWIFIFGKFGCPAMGADGAALGTLLAVTAEAFALWFYLARFRDGAAYGVHSGWRAIRRIWEEGRELRKFGVAPAVAAGLENIGFSLMSVMAAQLGAEVAAAFQAVIALHVAAFVAAIGCASAAGVRVGNAVGERAFADIARRGWIAGALAALVTAALSSLYLFFPRTVLQFFADETAPMMAPAIIMLLMMAPFILFDALQIVLVYALRAAGDPVFAAINQGISFLVIMVFAARLAIHSFGMTADGIALAMIIGIVTSAILMVVRFFWITRRQGEWIASKNPQGANSQEKTAVFTG